LEAGFALRMSYGVLHLLSMTTTLTFRLPAAARAKLRQRAKFLGKSESQLMRELVHREFQPRKMGERIGHLKGTLSFKGAKMDEWQKSIKENNWRL
jgi:hypothetical protein